MSSKITRLKEMVQAYETKMEELRKAPELTPEIRNTMRRIRFELLEELISLAKRL